MKITIQQAEIPADLMFPMDLCYDEPGFDFEVPFQALLQCPNSHMQMNGVHVFNFPDDVFRSMSEHFKRNK
jgi:hypothetical protein